MATRTGLDFDAISHELSASGRPVPLVAESLSRRCPSLLRHIEADAARRAMLRLWGESRNVDENTDTVIVPLSIIEALGMMARVTMDHPVVHAGVAHTYGYLFSRIETPYGRKRDRWVEGQIAQVLGVPARTLSPQPSAGTLLTNATYVLGRIAFRGLQREQRVLRGLRSVVPPELRDLKYRGLHGYRIVETFANRKNPIRVVTDLVEWPGSPAHIGRLLVYWWSDRESRARLMTAFPITKEAFGELIAPERFGDDVELAVRYNGFIHELQPSTAGYRGSRSLYVRSNRFRRVA